MAENEDKIAQLQTRLDNLVRTQISFQQEVTRISEELKRLRGAPPVRPPQPAQPPQPPPREYVPPPRTQSEAAPSGNPPPRVQQPPVNRTLPPNAQQRQEQQPQPNRYAPAAKSDSSFEKFIGENLISKIGIIVLIIGVAIGAKYAIDRDLISPFGRIAIGYAFGAALLALALWLKAKYHNFSAALISGAIAILYFITFFAYNLYGLFPQTIAFGLMILFTILAVSAAIVYSRQFIAHLGLVGAYAVPFLLSNDSGNYAGLFGYVGIINVGILAVCVKRYWKALFYTAFLFTWLIYGAWFVSSFNPEQHFQLAFIVLGSFFAIFYATFIIYKILSAESLAFENVALVLSNSFIFFGFGTAILLSQPSYSDNLGLFAVANAAIHFVVALIVGRVRSFPRDLTYLIVALIVTFATIAVPIQLKGNWILLVWTVEAAMLFAIGRTKGLAIFEQLSYPLMLLAAFMLLRSWVIHESLPLEAFREFTKVPIANGAFFSALLFAVAAGLIYFINRDEDQPSVIDRDMRGAFGFIVAAAGVVVFYNAIRVEIADYFNAEMARTALPPDPRAMYPEMIVNGALQNASVTWQINYTMIFVGALSMLNMSRWKNEAMAVANVVLSFIATALFITVGLWVLSEPRTGPNPASISNYYASGSFDPGVRYISFMCLGVMLLSLYFLIKQEFFDPLITDDARTKLFDTFLFTSLFFIGSSEVLYHGGNAGVDDIKRFGLSIFWGIYALGLIVLGIAGARKHLRIGGFVIFGLTLPKVFLYDTAGLGTIPKMLVFVALGGLLLVASFLYNKYKTLIFGENEN